MYGCIFLVHSIPMVSISVLMPVSLFWLLQLNKFWHWEGWILQLCSFSRLFGYLKHLTIPYKFEKGFLHFLQKQTNKTTCWNSDRDCIEFINHLGSTDILAIKCFYWVKVFFESLSAMFCSFQCACLSTLIKFTSSYFTLLDAILNGNTLIFFLDCSLHMYKKITTFCVNLLPYTFAEYVY